MTVAFAPVTHERPAPFAIENGDGRGRFVLTCDHASPFIPDDYAGLGLDDTDRLRHIGWDIGALGLTRKLGARLDAPLVHTTLSRLLLDVNRAPDAHDAIVAVSEDTAIPGNRDLSAAEREHRRRWIYAPYHDALESTIAARRARAQETAVVSIHSFTPVYRGVARPWRIGVLSGRDRRLADALLAELRAVGDTSGADIGDDALGLDMIGDNQPYAPEDGVYHTLERHAEAHGLPCVMLEIRNDLIRDDPGQDAWAARLAPLLQRALDTAVPQGASSPPRP
jgi:predicted N-formylglutamate amidohydrolase